MGDSIQKDNYSHKDEDEFKNRLKKETKILADWFNSNSIASQKPCVGMELEAWITGRDTIPTPLAQQMIKEVALEEVVPEISKFNFELNSEPEPFEGSCFSNMEKKILETWNQVNEKANQMNCRCFLIGTLPTLRKHMLGEENLTEENRYFALNKRVLHLRKNKKTHIHIEGKDQVDFFHPSILTECAATSLQTHLGVNQQNAASTYNSAIVASAPMSALAANAPYFFGKELWSDSRIPIFEQSVSLASFRDHSGRENFRVGLGNGYVRESIMELFFENLSGHPPILPELFPSRPEELKHLRMHNGTIWRWARPIVWINQENRPEVRLELRVPSSGPSVVDSIANAMTNIALVLALREIENLEKKIPFEVARQNFYQCCKMGVDAEITWIDGKTINIQKLWLGELIERCEDALNGHGVDKDDIQKYLLDIVKKRVTSGQNGSNWQTGFIHTHGVRFQEMLETYHRFQNQNLPVHLWR